MKSNKCYQCVCAAVSGVNICFGHKKWYVLKKRKTGKIIVGTIFVLDMQRATLDHRKTAGLSHLLIQAKRDIWYCKQTCDKKDYIYVISVCELWIVSLVGCAQILDAFIFGCRGLNVL